MKKGGGKAKGSAFEREVCRIFTKWITGKSKPVIFWRTASSGAQFTQTKGKGSKMAADLMAVEPEGCVLTDRFAIECKSYSTVSFKMLLKQSKSCKITLWWEQVVEDASKISKKPMLVFKSKYFPTCLMIRCEDLGLIESVTGVFTGGLLEWDGKAICLLEDFLSWCQASDMRMSF